MDSTSRSSPLGAVAFVVQPLNYCSVTLQVAKGDSNEARRGQSNGEVLWSKGASEKRGKRREEKKNESARQLS
jgi:hypothetical protein